ncbi:hypothetical protein AN958_03629 [Leucoagaricus sp. SymC.cos]|nr:hypothetical protein AN958_03629 [Leucoagaricus sp. SymC.cos]
MEWNVWIGLKFISLLQNMKLEDSGMSEMDIYFLQNPRSHPISDFELDVGLKLLLKLWLAFSSAPKTIYTAACQAALKTFPDLNILSYDQAKTLIHQISGVAPIFTDMCPTKSCVAFMGPFKDLNACLQYGAKCWKSSSGKKRVPLK